MKCVKIRYETKAAALWASRNMGKRRRKSGLGILPTKAYKCGTCKAWHLTSAMRRKRY